MRYLNISHLTFKLTSVFVTSGVKYHRCSVLVRLPVSKIYFEMFFLGSKKERWFSCFFKKKLPLTFVQSTGSHLVPSIRDTSISHINLPNSHFAPVYGKLKPRVINAINLLIHKVICVWLVFDNQRNCIY